eukprot:1161572-Pelagomonas_calceolata.AAC.2
MLPLCCLQLLSRPRVFTAGASFFIPEIINCANTTITCTINPKDHGPTYTINRTEIAAVLVALQQGRTSTATDSSSAINQIRNQLLKPMSMSTHLHAQILIDIITHINLSEAPVHFYKVFKSHSGIFGNEGADAFALQAAMLLHEADTSLNQAGDPFFHLRSGWLVKPIQKPCSHTELWALPNLQNKLKQIMHDKHKLGTASGNTYSYTNWQGLWRLTNHQPTVNDVTLKEKEKLGSETLPTSIKERGHIGAQTHQPRRWHMKAVTLKEQIEIMTYRTDTFYNGKHATHNSGHSGPALPSLWCT